MRRENKDKQGYIYIPYIFLEQKEDLLTSKKFLNIY